MLTVRRMFSLLHYRVILAQKCSDVKWFFLLFTEYSAAGLGIVDSGQFICRGKLAFELTIDNEQLTIKESLRDDLK